MRDKIDFKKNVHNGTLIGVLNFNLMIPVENAQIQRIDTNLTNTANVLYQKYISDEKFAARKQCLNFKKMEAECHRYNNNTQ